MSPAWESISAPRHLFLMFAGLCHSVTAYEVCMGYVFAYAPETCQSAGIDHLDWLQLPVYVPHEEERQILCYMQPMCASTW